MAVNIECYFSHLSRWHIKQTVNFAGLGALGITGWRTTWQGSMKRLDPHRFCDSSWDDGRIIVSPGCQGDTTGWGVEALRVLQRRWVSEWVRSTDIESSSALRRRKLLVSERTTHHEWPVARRVKWWEVLENANNPVLLAGERQGDLSQLLAVLNFGPLAPVSV